MGAWMPDGSRLVVSRQAGSQSNLFSQRVDGTGETEQLTRGGHSPFVDLVTKDGRTVVYSDSDPGTNTGYDLWTVDLNGDRQPRPLVRTPALDAGGRLDPDEHWLSYATNDSGRDEVKVTPFPSGGLRKQASTDSGREGIWAANGRELFYRKGDQVLAVAVEPGAPGTVLEKRL